MAFEGIQTKLGWYVASTAFGTTDQYCGVFLSTATNAEPDVRIRITSGERIAGILDDLGSESSGSAVGIVVYGVTKFRFSSTHAAIAVMDPLYTRSDGTFNNASSSSFYPAGYALDALAADTSGIISGFVSPSLSNRAT